MKKVKIQTPEPTSKWTQFRDMHSGGGLKQPPYSNIYIEAPQYIAEIVFYNRFGHNPNNVACSCCGTNYSITESDTLEKASGFDRGCAFGYVDKDGFIVSEKVAWKAGVGVDPKYRGMYLEIPNNSKYKFNEYRTLDEYLKDSSVLIIYAKDIQASEKVGEVPDTYEYNECEEDRNF